MAGRKSINSKSPLIDLTLQSVVDLDKSGLDGVSGAKLRKHLVDKHGKTKLNLDQFKKALGKLMSQGLLINVSHSSGANGIFRVNPEFEDFDSRGLVLESQTMPQEQGGAGNRAARVGNATTGDIGR